MPTVCSEICGDGLVFVDPCDDNNTLNGDGCDENCSIEAYWECSNGSNATSSVCLEICGDSHVVLEDCDDGNLIDQDGCSANCTF